MKIFFIVFYMLAFTIFANTLFAQNINPVPVVVPSLQIAPDARSGGMGDIGAATSPDVYSQHWNAAKYPFVESNAGFSMSYTPWLRKLVNDINMAYVVGYWKFSNDNLNAISASIRYFSLGNIALTDLKGDFWQNVSPNEMAVDVAYSRKLSETFSGAITLRYIRADYSIGDNDEITPGNAFAADISGYNQLPITIGNMNAIWGVGFNISNLGTKISYDGGNTSMFLPSNLRLGTSIELMLDERNSIAFSGDINKLLVPTQKMATDNELPAEREKRIRDYNNMSSISGVFSSFGDAPGGLKEELQEIVWSLGAEYIYNNQFSIRAGYFNESEYKGNRKYFSFGSGFKVSAFDLNAAYIVSTAQSNPLDQTLRLSLGFDLDGLKKLFR